MHPGIVDTYERSFGDYWDENHALVHALLKERLLSDGTRVMIEDEEVFTHKLEFQTDETMSAESYDRPHDEIDLPAMSDDKAWAYIYGEYILNGRITHFRGFGATQVETY